MTEDNIAATVDVDVFEMMDVSEEDFDEYVEVLEDIEPVIEDYAYAIEQEFERVNETEFMEKMNLQVIMDYNLKVRPRS